MKSFLLTVLVILGIHQLASAQQDQLARIEYAKAEESYTNEKYQEAIDHLEKVKTLLGGTNHKVMYMEIVCKNGLIPATISDEDLAAISRAQNQAEADMFNLEKFQGLDVDALLKLDQDELIAVARELMIKNLKEQGVDYMDLKTPHLAPDSKNLLKETMLVKEVYQLCSEYLANVPESTPTEKVTEVYKISQKLEPLNLGIDEMLAGTSAFDAKNYSLAIEHYTRAEEEGNTLAPVKKRQVELTDLLQNHRQDIIQGIVNNMVEVEGGTFDMCFTIYKAYSDRKTPVTLSNYSINRYEVTILEWLAVMDDNSIDKNTFEYQGTKTNIDRNEANTFVQRLKELTGKNFSLPTNAQWEFAAKGGIKSQNFKYAGTNNIEDFGPELANELGLYNMSDGVNEICYDLFDRSDKNFLSKKNSKDPVCTKTKIGFGTTPNRIDENGFVEIGDFCSIVVRDGLDLNMISTKKLHQVESWEGCGFRLAINK